MKSTSHFLTLAQYQKQYPQLVTAAANYIGEYLNSTPSFAITLGSGLADIAENISVIESIPYSEIPFFPETTVPGHEGILIIGKIKGQLIIGLIGRKHYYEGAHYPSNIGMLQSVFATHVMAELGVKHLFVTNAAGGLHKDFTVGDIMLISSHINMLPNPLLGMHYPFKRVDTDTLVDRFQPMHAAYDKKLLDHFLKQNKKYSKFINQGTYLAVTGPSYETEAECLAFRDGLGADAVGMSTTPEVIVARNRGMKVIGFSCITNKIAKDGTNATNHEEVKAVLESSKVRKRIASMVTNFFTNLDDQIK